MLFLHISLYNMSDVLELSWVLKHSLVSASWAAG